MSDHRALRTFAKLLPTEFRERVFDPALAEIELHERLHPDERTTPWASRAVLVIECLRLSSPQLIWSHGRITRIGISLLAAAGCIAVVLQRIHYAPHK